MGWAIASILGFLVVTVLVIWLARTNTARWEAHHRAAQAAMRAREEVSLRARAGALLAQGAPEGGRHLPHLHLPHVHLPPGVVARLPHPRVLLPHLHLPSLDGRFLRRLPHRARQRPADPASSVSSVEPFAPAVEEEETPTV